MALQKYKDIESMIISHDDSVRNELVLFLNRLRGNSSYVHASDLKKYVEKHEEMKQKLKDMTE